MIPITHSCGSYGFQLPWAQWMCRRDPIYPIHPSREIMAAIPHHIFIYSIKGQLSDPDRVRAVLPDRRALPDYVVCAVNIDQFIDRDSLAVNFDELANTITGFWVEHLEELEDKKVAEAEKEEPAKPVSRWRRLRAWWAE